MLNPVLRQDEKLASLIEIVSSQVGHRRSLYVEILRASKHSHTLIVAHLYIQNLRIDSIALASRLMSEFATHGGRDELPKT
jgi:hypothetical protein